jgi:hypothetical protein
MKQFLVAMVLVVGANSGCGMSTGPQGPNGAGGGGGTGGGTAMSDSGCMLKSMVSVIRSSSAPTVTVDGAASLSCASAVALVELKVCLQWSTSAGFEDVKCETVTKSNAALQTLVTQVSCTGQKTFRATADATVNGRPLPQVLSVPLDVTCR